MKRLITIVTGLILISYILIAGYRFTPPFFKHSFAGRVTNKVNGILGFGILFDKLKSLTGTSASYRFYQDGKWEEKKLLLEPLFNDYRATGNLTSLKHCRLDSHLVAGIHKIAKRNGIEKMKQSKVYNEFIDHLIYSHNKNIRPDSLEVFYYIKNYDADTMHLALNFKVKP